MPAQLAARSAASDAPWRLAALSSALPVLICADLIRPSLNWLVAGARRAGTLVRDLAASRDPRRVRPAARTVRRRPATCPPRPRRRSLYRSAVILAAKGGTLADITVGDVLELLDTEARGHRQPRQPRRARSTGSCTESGVLGERRAATLRELRTCGQRTPEELIDRYRLACRPVRDLLVDYLRERQPALDYTSLESLAYYLGKRFWADIEQPPPRHRQPAPARRGGRRVEAAAAHQDQDDHAPRRARRRRSTSRGSTTASA